MTNNGVNKMIFRGLLILVLSTVLLNGCSPKEPPDNEIALFKKAAQAEIANNYSEAVKIYESIIENYPKSTQYDKALFMIGFIKSENMDKKDEAKLCFEELIEKFPDSELVDDAEFMIEAINRNQDALTTFEEKTGK